MQHTYVKQLCLSYQLLKTELNNLISEAKEQMQGWINEGVQSVLQQMVSRTIESKLSEFSRPSMQFAFYTMLKGYSFAETIELLDLLVDAFIDRIQTNWDSLNRNH